MTLFIIKPDAVRRDLSGLILNRIEVARFRILDMRMLKPGASDLRAHYEEHSGKEWFGELLVTMLGQSMIVGLAEHKVIPTDSVEIMRDMIGPYQEPRIPGTIRGDFALNCRENAIHGSDSIEAAYREAEIWFR